MLGGNTSPRSIPRMLREAGKAANWYLRRCAGSAIDFFYCFFYLSFALLIGLALVVGSYSGRGWGV